MFKITADEYIYDDITRHFEGESGSPTNQSRVQTDCIVIQYLDHFIKDMDGIDMRSNMDLLNPKLLGIGWATWPRVSGMSWVWRVRI